MDFFLNAAAVQRLDRYFGQIGDVLGEQSRRGSFALYAMGLLADGERKSVEPLAARACPDPKRVDAIGRWVARYRQRPVSTRLLSNRTCGFPAYGLPRVFSCSMHGFG